MMDRGDIEARVRRIMHRTDFTVDDFDYGFFVANEAIGHDLRCRENETLYPIASASASTPFTLPAEVRQIERVEYKTGSDPWRPLSTPRDWEVIDGLLRWTWTVTGTIQMTAYTLPAYPASAAITNDVLSAYPDVYTWRVAAECAVIAQDAEMVSSYLSMYGRVVDEINIRTESGKRAAPAMRGA